MPLVSQRQRLEPVNNRVRVASSTGGPYRLKHGGSVSPQAWGVRIAVSTGGPYRLKHGGCISPQARGVRIAISRKCPYRHSLQVFTCRVSCHTSGPSAGPKQANAQEQGMLYSLVAAMAVAIF